MTPAKAKIMGASLVVTYGFLIGVPHLQLDHRPNYRVYVHLGLIVLLLLALIKRQV